MRAGFYGDWVVQNGEVVGIDLGSDFCAEHEWGILRLLKAFGAKTDGCGIERMVATKVPADHILYKEGTDNGEKAALLVYTPYEGSFPNKTITKLAGMYNMGWTANNKLSTAWDDNSFGVYAVGKENVQNLRALYDAILAGDVAFSFAKPKASFLGG